MPDHAQSGAIASAAVFDLLSATAALPPQTLARQTRLAELGMDSLKLVEIIYELETRFQVTVDENLLLELSTVADLITLVAHAISERSGAAR